MLIKIKYKVFFFFLSTIIQSISLSSNPRAIFDAAPLSQAQYVVTPQVLSPWHFNLFSIYQIYPCYHFLVSVQFSCSVVSDSLWPHESQHARPPCPSPTPRVHSDSRPLSQWCHPAISSSVVPFSSCPQSLPASESSPMSQLFTWGGQSTGVSALASFLPKKSQGCSPSEWTGWISLQSSITKVRSESGDITSNSTEIKKAY